MVEVSVTKCGDYGEVKKCLKKVLEPLGGLKAFVSKGDKILLKPNLLTDSKPEKAVTTHPALVRAVCEQLVELGCEVWVGDSSGGYGGVTGRALKNSGVKKVCDDLNVRLINFDDCEKQKIASESRLLRNLKVAKPVLEADAIISLPKLKTHLLTTYTGGVKNSLGCLVGGDKPALHRRAPDAHTFSKALLDVYEALTPKLVIMDAVTGMEGDGPQNGDKKTVGLLLASPNGVALDMVACKTIGFPPMSVPTNEQGVKRGISPPLKEVKVTGWHDSMRVQFEGPGTWLKGSVLKIFGKLLRKTRPQPRVTNECVLCKRCIESCPEEAITERGGKAVILEDKCIKCYCCHELCPANAIKLEKSLFRRFLDAIKKIKRKI